ncbi:MAG TPA: hypothetical protein VFX41_12045 [Actinomycetales bacterium]|nr:hypothetical protein [Actinomycetales bacterium]
MSQQLAPSAGAPPAAVVKTMAPRGPLQQYRVATATPFTCARCGAGKKSKLLTTVSADWDSLLCNGCYGNVVRFWEIKAGDLPDEERFAALLEALGKALPPHAVESTRQELRGASPLFGALSLDAQRMLATAHAVTTALRAATDLDWSAAVIGLCKAVEVEVVRLLMEPLRRETQAHDLEPDLADKELQRIARFCAGRAPAPELGSITHFLRTAANSKRRAARSPVLGAMTAVLARCPGAGHLTDAEFLNNLGRLTKEFRNPAAHDRLLTEDDFSRCVELVEGESGLLASLLSSTVV